MCEERVHNYCTPKVLYNFPILFVLSNGYKSCHKVYECHIKYNKM